MEYEMLRDGESLPLVRVLLPCQVPWMVSQSTSGLTLTHTESDVEHDCSIVFGGGRLTEAGRIDSRRIEVVFHGCERSTLGQTLDDEDLQNKGYELRSEARAVATDEYPRWLISQWRQTGICPESGLWVAAGVPVGTRSSQSKLFVIAGRNGYAEVVAAGFSWREWVWTDGQRDALANLPPIAKGLGVD